MVIPPSAINQRLFEIALRSNPDPSKLIPTLHNGFQQLKNRLDFQESTHMAFQNEIIRSSATLAELRTRNTQNQKRAAEFRAKLVELATRTMNLMRTFDVQQARYQPLNNEEVQLKNRLEALNRELQKPTQFRARVEELSSLVNLHADKLAARDAPAIALNAPEQQEAIAKFLQQQNVALGYLMDVLRNDNADLNIIAKGLAAATRGSSSTSSSAAAANAMDISVTSARPSFPFAMPSMMSPVPPLPMTASTTGSVLLPGFASPFQQQQQQQQPQPVLSQFSFGSTPAPAPFGSFAAPSTGFTFGAPAASSSSTGFSFATPSTGFTFGKR